MFPKIILLLVVFLTIVLQSLTCAQDFSASETTVEYYLHDWSLSSAETPEKLHAVRVPTTVLGALVDTGYFPYDPMEKMNLNRINQTMFSVSWVYNTTFTLSDTDDAACKSKASSCVILLLFDGINYRGNLSVNGRSVANSDKFVGALRRFEFDITSFVRPGKIVDISVSIQRPGGVNRTDWRNPSTDLSIDFLDWTPSPPDLSMGLFRPVRLLVVSSPVDDIPLLRFDGFVVHTALSQSVSAPTTVGIDTNMMFPSSLTAFLNVSVEVKNIGATTIKFGELKISFDLGVLVAGAPSVVVSEALLTDLPPGSSTRIVAPYTRHALLVVSNPPLWYPVGVSDQRPFFNGSILVWSKANPKVATEFCRWRYALRSAERRDTAGNAYQIYVNNVPVQIRGGGYVPDLYWRLDKPRLAKELAMIRSMGLNGIRLEGMLMASEFFSMADDLGIMVLFGIACCDGWQNWGYWPPENYEIARESVLTQARRLGFHPSVVLFLQSSDDLPPPRVEAMYSDALAQAAWASAVVSSADGWSSTLTGGSGVKMTASYSWVPPVYWLNDSNPLEGNSRMNYGGAFGFLTEGGPGESPMTFNSWNKTVGPNNVWDNTTGPLSEMWSFHMGHPYGHFHNLSIFAPALNARYGDSASAREFCFRSQLSNYEGIRAMFEAYARNRHINATGLIQWQINKGWPSNLWTLYEYYGIAHGGFYGAKGACGGSSAASASIHAMMSPVDGSVVLMQTTYTDLRFDPPMTVVASMYSQDGKSVWSHSMQVTFLPSNGVVPLSFLKLPINEHTPTEFGDDTYFVRLSWNVPPNSVADAAFAQFLDFIDAGTEWTSSNWYWLSRDMDVMTQADWDNSQYFHTPCSHYANLKGLNSLPTTTLTATANPVEGVPRDFLIDAGAAHLGKHIGDGTAGSLFALSVKNSGTNVALFVQLRLVNSTSGFDLEHCFYTENFITLLPSESRTVLVHCPIMPLSAVSADSVHLEIDSYNSIVAAHGSSKVVALGKKMAMPPRKNPIPPPSSNPSDDRNRKLAIILACLTGAFALTSIVFAIVSMRLKLALAKQSMEGSPLMGNDSVQRSTDTPQDHK